MTNSDTPERFVKIAVPMRAGALPKTTRTNPQTQLDQQPEEPLTAMLLDSARRFDGVTLASSMRAPAGTAGLYLLPEFAKGPPEAFMLGHEFAHFHPEPDSSLHMTLPDSIRDAALRAGWAVPHPLAGQPTVSPNLVMVFAPRDDAERDVVTDLLGASWRFALGKQTHLQGDFQ